MRRNGRGEVVKVKDLFDVYKKKLIAPQATVVNTFQEVISDLLNTTIEKNACSYTVATKTLHISVSGPLKSEILLRKKEILAHLKGRLGEKSAPTELL